MFGHSASNDLGQRTIQGLVCRGVRTEDSQEVSETWISADLAEVVEETRRFESGEIVRFRLHDVQIGDPDPGLFVVPVGKSR